MAADTTLRDTMNQGEAGRLPDVDREIKIGDLLNALINALANTETSVTVTSNVATLAATPVQLWDAKISAGTTVGSKRVLRVSNAYLTANAPAVGDCFWDGATKVKFNAADNGSAAHFKYSISTDSSCSEFRRALAMTDPS
jgi:hypothetical protein